ncbi:uncharacterized protein LOC114328079 [Diabrotica virgifera virgifera]|uniref:Uncharacterized protein LOC114328079 n=1 Tax=Diabrotica virgifera virgifera TaxID=50390 RepID=A0A6P7FHQ7_DIAVI|nr:uncharacterized protein LOC114328079 [Diabrotica virgifera virgifera]
MCLCNKGADMNKTRSPRSPYRRQHREIIKPRLSRRIVPSARVNLNNYWLKFEELHNESASCATFDSPSTAELLRNSQYSTFQDNEINENLVNELLELAKL